MFFFYDYLYNPLSLLRHPVPLLALALWIWMLVHCIRYDVQRNVWLWVLIVFGPIGALIYFFARWLPHRHFEPPPFLRRWTRGKELERLQLAARQIGNAHQFVQWGDALRSVGKHPEAADAFAKALEKEPANLQALWGAGQVEIELQKYGRAKETLAQVIEADATYKFGDVSLAYGKCLYILSESDAARAHLEEHLKRWKHPEGHVLYANLLVQNGEHEKSRDLLVAMLMEISGGPKFFARQSAPWVREARRLLRKLPRG